MKKSPYLFVHHIYDAIEEILSFTEGYTLVKFLCDVKTQRAVTKSIEIIGEATRQIPMEFIKQHPHIPWTKLIATRNQLSHGYAGISYKLIWDIVENHIPTLKIQIAELIAEEKDKP